MTDDQPTHVELAERHIRGADMQKSYGDNVHCEALTEATLAVARALLAIDETLKSYD